MIGPTGCRAYSSEAAMPKLPPPPRIAQKRSGFSSCAGAQHAAVGHDHLGRAQVVEREAVLRHQPAEPAAERQAGDAGLPTTPPVVARPCSCVSRLNSFQSTPPCARAVRARRIDVNALHRRQIDHQAAVDRRPAGDVVAAAAHRDLEAERARQLDGVDDVGDAAAAGDQRPDACR